MYAGRRRQGDGPSRARRSRAPKTWGQRPFEALHRDFGPVASPTWKPAEAYAPRGNAACPKAFLRN